jgi:hypothetical protein
MMNQLPWPTTFTGPNDETYHRIKFEGSLVIYLCNQFNDFGKVDFHTGKV